MTNFFDYSFLSVCGVKYEVEPCVTSRACFKSSEIHVSYIYWLDLAALLSSLILSD